MSKPILLSGIQPTGRLHIGNYLGALKNWVELQNSGKYQCYFFVADLHALTENPDPKDLRENIINLAADYLAAGIDPKQSVVYQQSRIPAHSELAWILNTITPMGELERMTQFKDKAKKAALHLANRVDSFHKKMTDRKGQEYSDGFGTTYKEATEEARSISHTGFENVGLFDYPVLMAADIILYDAAFVPVGDDQDQHLELTRTLVRKFNSRFGETFVEPKGFHTATPRVMSLSDPSRKMSKSEPAGCLFLDDSPAEIEAKVKRAVTDSGKEIAFDEKKKPAIANLLRIYSSLCGEPIPKLEKQLSGEAYSYFKSKLAELVVNHFAEFRMKKAKLINNQSSLTTVLRTGSVKAAKIAEKKIAEVKEKIGATPL
jgi:tryptophanyl-tRNA synthetase